MYINVSGSWAVCTTGSNVPNRVTVVWRKTKANVSRLTSEKVARGYLGYLTLFRDYFLTYIKQSRNNRRKGE